MATGKSCTGDTKVLAKMGDIVKLISFKELWYYLEKRHKVRKLYDVEIIEEPDIEILTLTGTEVRWVRPKYLIRHRYIGKVYRIRTKTGRIIKVTPDHSLLVWKIGDSKDRFVIRLEVVKPHEIIERKTYLPYLRKLTITKNQVIRNKKVKNPLFGYLVGFFIAEGYYNSGLPRLYQANGDILVHVLLIMNKLSIPYRISSEKRKPHMRYITIYDPVFKLHVKPEQIGGNARSKRIPDIFWNMSDEWRSAFLAGIIDGDGAISSRDYIIEITTASEELAYGLLYAFASVGIHAYLRVKRIKKYPNRTYYRVYIPIGINKNSLKKIMRWMSPEKKEKIEEVMKNSRNYHSETDIIPKEVAYAIGAQLKRVEHGRCERLSFELRSYMYKDENPSFYRIEKMLDEKLYEFIPKNVGFDEVVSIDEEEYEGYVYDFEVPGTQNFEANGIFVHNTTALQALLTLGPPDYKYVTIEDTPELRLPHQHWHPLYTRRGYTIGSSQLDIDLFELTKLSLRLRGQYIVIGEVRGKEIQTLVQAAATGQGSACTFHANSIEEAFMRMTSPPLNVKPAFLMLIWAIVLMRRVKLRDGRVVRRMAKVWEIRGVNLESNKPIPLDYTTVFAWDPYTDSFKPNDPNEVFEKSCRLKQIAEANALTKEELIEELEIRSNYIEEMVRERIFDYNNVAKRLFEFYKYKQGI